jgi:hypothetical protein
MTTPSPTNVKGTRFAAVCAMFGLPIAVTNGEYEPWLRVLTAALFLVVITGQVWLEITARRLRRDSDNAPPAGLGGDAIDVAHLERQRDWSRRTFGPQHVAGVIDHIRKELVEIEADPADLGEWVDVVILALDGAWRAGHEPGAIIRAIKDKQARNEART